MQPLFITTEKLAEFGGFSVSADPTQWTKEVITEFLKSYPFLQEQPLVIQWHKTDFDRGYAVGSLKLFTGAVPVLIQEWRCSPLDVYLSEEINTPITTEMLYELMSNASGFQGLQSAAPKGTTALFGSNSSALQFSPNEYLGTHQSKITSRPAVKVASAVDHIQDFGEKQVASLLEKVAQNELLVEYLHQMGWDDLLKAVEQKAQTKEAAIRDFARSLEVDRQLVYQDGEGNYFVKQANSSYLHTWTTRVSAEEAKQLDELLVNTEVAKTASIKYQKEIKSISIQPGEVGEFSDIPGEVKIISVDRVKQAGQLFKTPSRVLQVEGQNWTEIPSGEHKLASVSGEKPKIGQFGLFVTSTEATEPFEVVGMQMDMSRPGGWEIKGASNFKIASYFPLSAGQQIEKREEGGYWIPKTASWVVLNQKSEKIANFSPAGAEMVIIADRAGEKLAFYIGEFEKTEQIGENIWLLSKTAQFTAPQEKIAYEGDFSELDHQNHWVYRDKAGFYRLSGRQFATLEKTADLNQLEAKWALIHCGATREDLEKVAHLHKDDFTKLEGKIQAPKTLDQLEKQAEQAISSYFSDEVEVALDPLIKIAQNLREKSSIDAILALGLLRKKNIYQFLQLLPNYEMVMAELAKLIVAARLGMLGVSPEPIKDAMEGLSQVVLMLKTLQSHLEEQK